MNRTRITLALTAMFALAAPTLAQQADTELGSVLREARQFAQQAREAYPKNAWNVEKPLWKSAVNAAERAVKLAPNNPEALRLRADLYTEVRFWSRAANAWKTYFAAGGNGEEARAAAAETQYNLGYAAYIRGRPAEARAAFASCIEFDPAVARCHAWAGRVELESNAPAAAVPFYEQAVKLDPNDKVSAYFLGVAKQAGEYGPAATRAFSRAYADLDASRRQPALAGFREAARLAPEFTEAWRYMGRIALDLGQGELAREAWENVVRLEGATEANRYFLEYAREVEQYGLNAVKLFREAYATYQKGDRAAAERGFETATRANAEYQKAWAWLGRTRFERQDYRGAAAAYREAVRLDPDDKGSAYFLERALREQQAD